MPQTEFALEVHPGSRPNYTIIAPKGPLVLEHLFRFQDAWRHADCDGLIFDLSEVSYLDSSAIGSLVNAHVSCSNRRRRMGLAGVSERVRQMLIVTRVDTLFAFFPDVAQAERAFSGETTSA
jgi:anti-sigma B factor antagonist